MSDDLSGRTLGRYHVLERLGRGGMAEVYRAYQPSLDRFVALKVIYPHLADDAGLLDRFGREARAVAALRHPNIVQVHDFDVQSGSAFMAMEFINGPTLKSAVQSLARRGRLLPLPVVAAIVGQIADALAYAHEQQLVHRDVKPANVLLRRRAPADAPLDDAATDELLLGLGPADVVLTDFGVARIIKDSIEHTAAGTILGSPAYMSPEQGRGERVDRRSDIYSLGVVLYELLTGQVPFDADTPFAVVLKHTTAPLPPPRGLRPDLPEALERILLKSLAKDPADRFQDAGAFGAAVREQCAGGTRNLVAAPRPAAAAPRPVIEPAPARPASTYETRVIESTFAPPRAEAAQPAPAQKPQKRRGGRGMMMMGCLSTVAIAAVVAVVSFFAGGAAVFGGLAGAGALVVPTQYQAEATAIAGTAVAEGREPPAIFKPQQAGALAGAPPMPPEVAEVMDEVRALCGGPPCAAGSVEEALGLLDAAIDEGATAPQLLLSRARLRRQLGDAAGARADLREARGLNPSGPLGAEIDAELRSLGE